MTKPLNQTNSFLLEITNNLQFFMKTETTESKELQPIVFYCKNCKEIVETQKKGKTLTFICNKCSQGNIAIGTRKSIESFYHLNK